MLLEVSMGGFKSSIVTQATTVRLVPYKLNKVKVLGKGTFFMNVTDTNAKKTNKTTKPKKPKQNSFQTNKSVFR